MANLSTTEADAMLDSGLTASMYVGLYTTAPTMPAGTGGTEVTGGSYARQILTSKLAAAVSGSKTTSADITFPAATGRTTGRSPTA